MGPAPWLAAEHTLEASKTLPFCHGEPYKQRGKMGHPGRKCCGWLATLATWGVGAELAFWAEAAWGEPGCQPAASPVSAPPNRQGAGAAQPRGEEEPHFLEFTFGSAQIFYRQSILTETDEIGDEVIPVSAALLMGEWMLHPSVSVVGLVSLPLEAQTTVSDGQLRQEFVAPSFSLGARVTFLSVPMTRRSVLELQLAAAAGRTVGSPTGDRFFPLVASRVHFHTHEGFTLYLGGATAFGENTTAAIYGIGYRF